MTIDTIGQILWWSIFATPVLSWLVMRKRQGNSENSKWGYTVILTLFLAIILFFISMSIILRNGLGPT